MKLPSQFVLCIALSALLYASLTRGQNLLTTEGRIAIDGKPTAYLIRHLPISSFPELPAPIQAALNLRGCMIPQTYQAHRPENVVHASLERAGSSDWAVLCSAKGTVSLLVFFAGAKEAAEPMVLASAPETDRLEAHGASSVLGFNWGIDPATPAQVHEAQAGLTPRPVLIDHDALADETIDQRTVYRYFSGTSWVLLGNNR